MTPQAEIHVLDSEAALANEVADFLAWSVEQTLHRQPIFRLVLSGGSTPRALYCTLAHPRWAEKIPWPRIRFFFGDERCVPATHAESNYAMAKATLFEPLRISEEHIHRMRGEVLPSEAADAYEATIQREFASERTDIPDFDVVLLGLGEDGHTASLFPGSPALGERERLVVAAPSPVGIAQRITMTYPLLNHAKVVVFMVTGRKKASILKRVLETEDTPLLPAARIRPTSGRLLWYLDELASADLAVRQQGLPEHEE